LTNKWSKRMMESLRRLNDRSPKDRLETCSLIMGYLQLATQSIVGWIYWLNNPTLMSDFSEEDLEEILSEIRRFVNDFIALDVKYTDRYGGKDQGSRDYIS